MQNSKYPINIAIVGMAVKLPKADTLDDFWNNIVNKIDTVDLLPPRRRKWIQSFKKFTSNGESNQNSPEGAYIKNIEEFDNNLFQVSPKEAELLDPNQRLFLQVSFEAIERAGYSLENIRGSNTGVYVGFGDDSDYYEIINRIDNDFIDIAKTGNLRPIIASRLSYLWDLKGPSMIIDTSCSSSLVAVHVAGEALRNHECDMAIAGGIKLSILPDKNNSNIGVESKTFRTKTFDDQADGTTWGEGVGVVILKRMEDAKRDGDIIYGIVKGSMINQDGKSAGITAPSQKAQENLIVNTWKKSEINPEDICYIEAHGTGTNLGDPIEIEGLRRAFSRYTEKKQFCAIGSTKPNIGHTVHASGIISLIKVLLSIQHKCIPPLTNFVIPNKNIFFENTALYIPIEREAIDKKMICCISSFGVSGTNVHMVIEENDSEENFDNDESTDYYLVFSGREKNDLKIRKREYIKEFESIRAFRKLDVCYTSACCANHYPYRIVIKFRNYQELKKALLGENDDNVWRSYDQNANEKYDNLPQLYKEYLAGKMINFREMYKEQCVRKVPLPITVFHNRNFWIEIPKLNAQDESVVMAAMNTDVSLYGKEKDNYTEIERKLSRIIKKLTGYEKIDVYKNLGEIGGDSILLAKFVSKVNEEFSYSLNIADVFSHPSICQLAQFIESKNYSQKVDVLNNTCYEDEDIAIVGISAKLPDADNIFEFWDNLVQNKNCIHELEQERKLRCLRYLHYVDKGPNAEFSCGGYMRNIEDFDYNFFNLSPREASLMDPHQRLLLQEAWKAIIDAGYTENDIRGSNTGVYIGYTNDFRFNYWQIVNNISPESYAMAITPNLTSIIPSRISYLLDLKGPSLLIDTACSSSLVAVHMACEELKNKKCNIAITGGVRVNLMPLYNNEKNIGIESPDFSIRAFDNDANGTVWGEGVVVFVLKRLKEAQNDKNHKYGVIKASSINQDGTSAGITAPNPAAQTDVLINCWNNAKIDPELIDYIECHGTGTNLGDPIETAGIQNAFEKYTEKKQFCGIGSVKSSIGHLDAVSGAASLLKVVLAMNYNYLPGSINFSIPNEAIEFYNSPIYFQKNGRMWMNKNNRKRIAGVSSFGFSGTNAHMVIEEGNTYSRKESKRKSNLFILSAKTRKALFNLLEEYKKFLEFPTTYDISDICYTLSYARNHYSERFAIVVKDLTELRYKINQIISTEFSHFTIQENLLLLSQTEDDIYKKSAMNYLQGEGVDWDLLFQDECNCIVSLPTYSFEKNMCWVEIPKKRNINLYSDLQKIIEKENSNISQELKAEILSLIKRNDSNAIKNSISLFGRDNNIYTVEEEVVAEIWADVLGIEKININDDFFEVGGHSIAMIQIVNMINAKLSVSLKYSEFNNNTTICKLAEYIKNLKKNNDITVMYPAVNPEPDTLYEEFPLTDIQMSYLLGRQESFNMGGVCTHVYMEVETNLDILRLEDSLNKVIARHPMLYAVVEPSGKQHILKQVPRYKIDIRDISELSDCKQEEIIASERSTVSHHVFKAGEWPLIGVSALKLGDKRHYLFIEFDMLIADGSSLQIIGNEWMAFYRDENLRLPELQFTFKDYMRGLEEFKKNDIYKADKKFWLQRLNSFPNAPKLKYVNDPNEIVKPTFRRLSKVYNRERWQKIKKVSQSLGVSPSALLCAAFSEVLAYWSNEPHFAINLTVFNRYPFHQEVDSIIGDFTSVMLVEVELKEGDDFSERVKKIQKEILTNLEHRHYDGVEFIRELANKRNKIGEPIMPIVFTSMLFNNESNPWDQLGETKMGLSQTPQVFLDHQAGEIGGELVINWDYVSELFDEVMITDMFKQYIGVLNYLTEE